MTSKRRTFLVTGARSPGALEWIRRLSRAGRRVLAADSLHAPVSRFSRCLHRYFRVPGPRLDPLGFVAALRGIAKSEGVEALLPTCEEIYYISRYREMLDDVCEVFCADFDTLQTLHHKERFARLTQLLASAVAAPESVLISEAAQLRVLAAESREWVFKPVYSRFASRTLVRPSAAEVARLTVDSSNPWLAQRFVAGRELSSYGIAVRGKLMAHTLYHSRHRAGRTAGIYFAPEENATARLFVEQIVAHLGYTGQIAFDFIACEATGRVFALECNPRLTSGVHLLEPGFDLDRAWRGQLCSSEGRSAGRQAKMLGAGMVMYGLPQALAEGQTARWRRDYASANDVLFAADDPWPVLGQLAFLAEMGARSLRQGVGIMAATTADIEWNGQTLA